MRKYRFRLQKVMDAKKCKEDRKKQDLACAQRMLDREKQILLHLQAQEADCREEMMNRPAGPLDIARERMYRARFRRLMRDIDRQCDMVDQSRNKVSEEREALIQCSKEHKMLENLKERGLLESMRQWIRREQKETDEVGRDTFLRKPNGAAGI
jgi:flagellar export protein FliJ